MSGLVAVQPLSGNADLGRTIAQRLSQAIAHRGPDGQALRTEGRVTLAHAFLDSTGDGAGPWRLRDDGPLLTGDLCLSNTAELCDAGPVSDAAAILRAYDRWGLDLATHLHGAFAFVLWDPARERLLAVRDRFGIKPLCLRHLPDMLMMCSEPGPLAVAHGPLPQINEAWVADFLAGYETSASHTADLGIDRLPPGHILISENGSITRRQWYALPDETRAADPAEEFAALLDLACKAAMRGGKTGAMLSGGLDSSSICLLAHQHSAKPLPTFSRRFPDTPELDEGRFIDAVLAAGSFEPVSVNNTPNAVLDHLDAALLEQQQPSSAPGLGTTRHLFQAARARGLTAMLDGHGGDEVVSQGYERFTALARQGKLIDLARTCRSASAFMGLDWMPLMLSHLAASGPRPWSGLARRVQAWTGDAPTGFGWRGLVNPDLALRSDLVGRVQQIETAKHKSDPASGMTEEARVHRALAFNAATSGGFEQLDRAAARAGIDPRYPFYDHRLVEWCVAQPASAKLRDGVPRSLLRNGMRGILPEIVRMRSDKINFIEDAWRGLTRDPAGTIAGFATRPPDRLAPFVNQDVLRQVASVAMTPNSTPDHQVVFFLWRAIWLDLWLAARAQRTPAAVASSLSQHSLSVHSLAARQATDAGSKDGYVT